MSPGIEDKLDSDQGFSLYKFLTHVPSYDPEGLELPVQVHELTRQSEKADGRSMLWHKTVQSRIAQDPSRPDAKWNWPTIILNLAFMAGARRNAKIYQMTIGEERKPAAMLAVLLQERWFRNRA